MFHWAFQVGHVSLESVGSDSLGLNESLCRVSYDVFDVQANPVETVEYC